MLYLVATPLGSPEELSLLSLRLLKDADLVICESTKEASTLLKFHGLRAKTYAVLNEHTKAAELDDLVVACKNQNVVLVSDCGTPGFCDPGADLVKACRKNNILVRSSLGPSSLMGLLSLCGEKVNHFYFRGFLPVEKLARTQAWRELQKTTEFVILMDTPYRFKKVLNELKAYMPHRKIFLACNLSQDIEFVCEAKGNEIERQVPYEKAEFILMICPP